jgi:hypothetical protein
MLSRLVFLTPTPSVRTDPLEHGGEVAVGLQADLPKWPLTPPTAPLS